MWFVGPPKRSFLDQFVTESVWKFTFDSGSVRNWDKAFNFL
jgi:hypothetical protein